MTAPDDAQSGGPAGSPRDSAPDAIVKGVSEVVSAAIGVGASVAKAFAQATAAGKPLKPGPDDRPLEALVHYTVTTVTNVMGLVVSGLETGARPKRPRPDAAGPAPGGPRLPTVRRGAVLRVPLSIENPAAERMEGLRIVCLAIVAQPRGPGKPLGERSVRFQPEVLDIAPRDFEKLTVFVDTAPDTAPGIYEAMIGLGAEGFDTRLRFEVVTEAQA